MSDEDRFGVRLRFERQRRRWTQAQVAEKLAEEGVTLHPSAIAKMETRDVERPRSISLNEAAAIARVFGLTPTEMYRSSQHMLDDLAKFATRWIDNLEDGTLLTGMVAEKVGDVVGLLAANEVEISDEIWQSIRFIDVTLQRGARQLAHNAEAVPHVDKLMRDWANHVAGPVLGSNREILPRHGGMSVRVTEADD